MAFDFSIIRIGWYQVAWDNSFYPNGNNGIQSIEE
jgi:hypothetical protein